MDVPHAWGHNSETKTQIEKLITCGSWQWPTLSNGMLYLCMKLLLQETARQIKKKDSHIS